MTDPAKAAPSKEWCLKMAELEGNSEIGAGSSDHPLRNPAKAAPMREDVTPGDRFRHVKRGTEYEVVGVAQLQTTDPLFDDSVMVVYRGDDGQLWTREVHEFLDRRFERLAHTTGCEAVSLAAVDDGLGNDWFSDQDKLGRPDAGDENVERVALPDIGPDPMKGDRSNRVEQATARIRQAYVKQQAGVPDQTALVWRWDISAILAENTRLAAMREWVDRGMVEVTEANVDWRKIAILAGDYGIRYRTNAALVKFLNAALSPEQPR